MRSRSVAVLFAATLSAVCASTTLMAQPSGTTVQMSGTLAGARATFSGSGECHHSDAASIYETPAAMWHASFAGGTGIDRLNITLWQPKSGGPMQITLSATAGRTQYTIGTVKGGALSGSGTARVERQGPGGTLTIQGQTASGAAIQLSVACSKFSAPEDNG